MTKVTIIGANSYIARNLIFRIKERQKNCMFYLYDYNDKSFDEEVTYQSLDVFSREEWENVNFDVDYIYFFTGKTGGIRSFDGPEDYVKVNEIALLNMLCQYVSKKSRAKIIFPSTRLVYKGNEQELCEDAEKEFKTIYAINKYACENYIKMYNNLYGVKYCIVRICLPYGTNISEARSYGTADFMINTARRGEDITIYGDGGYARTLTHINDLADALIEVMSSEKCNDDVYNIGGERYTLYEMAQLIADKFNVKVKCVDWPIADEKIESKSTVFCSKKFDQEVMFKYNQRFKDWVESL